VDPEALIIPAVVVQGGNQVCQVGCIASLSDVNGTDFLDSFFINDTKVKKNY
jgi:hypothetical protein